MAALLDQLGEGWTVIHSLPIGERGSDIDHLVIGPPGVFTINTKFSPGKDVWYAGRGMYVGGSKQHYIVNALFEARRASTRLSQAAGLTVPVMGIIAFVNPARMTEKAPPGGGEDDPIIEVVRDSELLNEFNRRREYSDEQLARIVDAAVRPSTWSQLGTDGWSLSTSSPGLHLGREFEALEQEVGPRLELPRGQVRSVASRSRPVRTQSRPASSPRNRPTTSRSRKSRSRRKASLLERFLGGFVLPILGALFFYWVIQQALANYAASL